VAARAAAPDGPGPPLCHERSEAALLEVRIDHAGLRVEIEQLAQARQQRHERRQQRQRDLDVEMRAGGARRTAGARGHVRSEDHAAAPGTAGTPEGAGGRAPCTTRWRAAWRSRRRSWSQALGLVRVPRRPCAGLPFTSRRHYVQWRAFA
jgi:hypothetical protein